MTAVNAAVAAGEMYMMSDAVLTLTGHAPMTFEKFLRRYPESYRPRCLPDLDRPA